MHPFAYATSRCARLLSKLDIRQPDGKFANHYLQSVRVCIRDSYESVANALSEPALLSTVISYIDSLTLSLSQQTCVCVCEKTSVDLPAFAPNRHFHLCVCVCCRSLRASICCLQLSADALSEPASFIDAPSILCFRTESNVYGC